MYSIGFAKTYGFLTGTQFNNEFANFGIYNKIVIEKVLEMGDYSELIAAYKLGFVIDNDRSLPILDKPSGESSAIFAVENLSKKSELIKEKYRQLLNG